MLLFCYLRDSSLNASNVGKISNLLSVSCFSSSVLNLTLSLPKSIYLLFSEERANRGLEL